jgi:hypothetical protein
LNGFAELHEFFAASVGAAAALIGLLFVAISVAPERTFGPAAEIERRLNAERAFTALGNVFFVSLGALLPNAAPSICIVFAVLAIVQIVRMALQTYRTSGWANWKRFGLFAFCVYVFEFGLAQRIAANVVAAGQITYVILGLFVYALGTSWGLLSSAGRD